MVTLGIERLVKEESHTFKGKRIGLLTNHTGVLPNCESVIDLLHKEVGLDMLFSPEHGIRGAASAGEGVGHGTDKKTGLPIFSLYGESPYPPDELIAKLDYVLVDLQDIGTRYYTYIYSMANVIEVCARTGTKTVILDRPNPIGGQICEGAPVEPEYFSFVGQYQLPVRHTFTIGELALFLNKSIGADVRTIRMDGWERSMLYNSCGLPFVPPSPNATGLDMMLLYPGTCLIEGTSISEGRGTTKPFEMIGAPFIDGDRLTKRMRDENLDNVYFRPVAFVPSASKYCGELCSGVQIHLKEQALNHSLHIGIRLVAALYELYPDEMEFPIMDKSKRFFFDLLAGCARLRNTIESGEKISDFIAELEAQAHIFVQQAKPFYLY